MNAIIRTLLLIVMSALACGATGQTTGFTYQGQLKDGDVPAAGQHDFRFRLFDASSGGTQLGTTQCVDNIQVNDGVFTTLIDFGPQFTTTAQRFIEIQVRRDVGQTCADTTGFTTLAPRQPITPAPTATQAGSAFSLAAPDGSPAKAVFVGNDGNVGIGTISPATSLDVQAPISGLTPGAGVRIRGTSPGVANLAYMDFFNSIGARIGYVGDGGGADNSIYLQSDTGNVALSTAAGTTLSATPSGNVGIGTATPAARLDVRGEVRYGSVGQYRPIAGEEPLRMIRGKADSSGGLLVGLGWSAVRESTGTFRVTFATPFTGLPVVTASADASLGFVVATVSSVTPSSALIRLRDSGDSLVNLTFGFIAVGPR